jgi:hypothetical protein
MVIAGESLADHDCVAVPMLDSSQFVGEPMVGPM